MWNSWRKSLPGWSQSVRPWRKPTANWQKDYMCCRGWGKKKTNKKNLMQTLLCNSSCYPCGDNLIFYFEQFKWCKRWREGGWRDSNKYNWGIRFHLQIGWCLYSEEYFLWWKATHTHQFELRVLRDSVPERAAQTSSGESRTTAEAGKLEWIGWGSYTVMDRLEQVC